MRRGLITVSLATLAILSAASSAAAIGPTRTPFVNEAFTFGGVCSFRVQLTPLVDREILKEFPNGRFVVNGRLLVRLRNVQSGASLVVNASGPATFTFRESSVLVRAQGRGLLLFFPGDLGPGSQGGLFLANGLVVEVFDEDGLTVVRLPHNRRNLCRELAG